MAGMLGPAPWATCSTPMSSLVLALALVVSAPPAWIEAGQAAPTDGYLLAAEDAAKFSQSVVDLRVCHADSVERSLLDSEALRHCQASHRIDKDALHVCQSRVLDPELARTEVNRPMPAALLVVSHVAVAVVAAWAGWRVSEAL